MEENMNVYCVTKFEKNKFDGYIIPFRPTRQSLAQFFHEEYFKWIREYPAYIRLINHEPSMAEGEIYVTFLNLGKPNLIFILDKLHDDPQILVYNSLQEADLLGCKKILLPVFRQDQLITKKVLQVMIDAITQFRWENEKSDVEIYLLMDPESAEFLKSLLELNDIRLYP